MKYIIILSLILIGCRYTPTTVHDAVYGHHNNEIQYRRSRRHHRTYYKNQNRRFSRHSKYRNHDRRHPHRISTNHGRHW